jgi:hypothetical protein
MAVIFFLALVALVAGVWALIAYARAGAKAADTGIDRASPPQGPSLFDDDLSFAGRTGGRDTDGETTAEPADDPAEARP